VPVSFGGDRRLLCASDFDDRIQLPDPRSFHLTRCVSAPPGPMRQIHSYAAIESRLKRDPGRVFGKGSLCTAREAGPLAGRGAAGGSGWRSAARIESHAAYLGH